MLVHVDYFSLCPPAKPLQLHTARRISTYSIFSLFHLSWSTPSARRAFVAAAVPPKYGRPNGCVNPARTRDLIRRPPYCGHPIDLPWPSLEDNNTKVVPNRTVGARSKTTAIASPKRQVPTRPLHRASPASAYVKTATSRSVQPSIAMDSDSRPAVPPSFPHPPALSDGQLIVQPRRPAVSNCRRPRAPTATSGPPPEHAPHDDVVATGTWMPTTPGTCRSSDAQPPLPAHEGCLNALGSTFGPRGLTYTPVFLSRNLGHPVHDPSLKALPPEILLHILGYLDVCDLLPISRVSTKRTSPRRAQEPTQPNVLESISVELRPPRHAPHTPSPRIYADTRC